MARCEAIFPRSAAMSVPCSHTDQWQHGPSTETHLISLTRSLINLFNSRVWEHPAILTHISPNIIVDLNGVVGHGVDTFVGNYKIYSDLSPGFAVDLFNESAIVDEVRGTAVVLMSQDIQFHSPEGRRMAGAIAFSWERKVGGWHCNACCMMYGTAEFLVG